MKVEDRIYLNRISARLQGFSWKSENLAWCRCPVCGDSEKKQSKKRFYIFEKEGKTLVYCHNCGFSKSFGSFLKFQFPDVYRDYIMEMMKKEEAPVQKKHHFTVPKATEKTWDFDSICEPIKGSPIEEYVNMRQIPHKKVLYCPNIKLIHDKLKEKPALIIPFYRKNKPIEVLQIRQIKTTGAKYLTFKWNDDSLKVYNLDFVDQSRPVYITEGPIDSMMLDNAIAVSGSNLEIAKSLVKNPVFVFDNEPRSPIICQKMWRVIKEKLPIVIYPPQITLKDLNDMVVKKRIDVNKLVKENTVSGLQAELCFHSWISCNIKCY